MVLLVVVNVWFSCGLFVIWFGLIAVLGLGLVRLVVLVTGWDSWFAWFVIAWRWCWVFGLCCYLVAFVFGVGYWFGAVCLAVVWPFAVFSWLVVLWLGFGFACGLVWGWGVV